MPQNGTYAEYRLGHVTQAWVMCGWWCGWCVEKCRIPLKVQDERVRVSPDSHGFLGALVLLALRTIPRIVFVQNLTETQKYYNGASFAEKYTIPVLPNRGHNSVKYNFSILVCELINHRSAERDTFVLKKQGCFSRHSGVKGHDPIKKHVKFYYHTTNSLWVKLSPFQSNLFWTGAITL